MSSIYVFLFLLIFNLSVKFKLHFLQTKTFKLFCSNFMYQISTVKSILTIFNETDLIAKFQLNACRESLEKIKWIVRSFTVARKTYLKIYNKIIRLQIIDKSVSTILRISDPREPNISVHFRYDLEGRKHAYFFRQSKIVPTLISHFAFNAPGKYVCRRVRNLWLRWRVYIKTRLVNNPITNCRRYCYTKICTSLTCYEPDSI